MSKTRMKTHPGRAKLPLSRMILMVSVGVSCVFSLPASAQEQIKKKSNSSARTPFYTITKETTFVTGPLAKDGHIDFVAAINDRYSKGVTPQNNAAVLYLKALGPYAEGNKLPDKVFKQLGMKKPPIKGDYFLGFGTYLTKKTGLKYEEEYQKWLTLTDQRSLAQKQPWKATAYPQLANWLKYNEKPLKLIVEGTKRSRYFMPILQTQNDNEGKEALMGSWIPICQHARGYARALACRAMMKINDKKFKEARQDLLACHRLAGHIGQGNWIMHAYVSYAIEKIAFQGDLVFLQHSKPTAAQVSQYLKEFNTLHPLANITEKYNFGERLTFLDSVVLISRNFYTTNKKASNGRLSGGSYLKGFLEETELVSKRLLTPYPNWIIILKQSNRTFDRVVRVLRLKDRKLRTREFEALQKKFAKYNDLIPQKIEAKSALKSNAVQSERIGKILINSMLPVFTLEAEHRAKQRQRNLILAFALAAYKSDHKNYPQKLAELSPKYLPKIPQDIFADKPLKYEPSKNGYLLYSLGPNGVDDKGDRNTEMRDGPDDIAVKMPITFVK